MYVNPYENLTGGRWLKANFHTHAGTGEGTCGRWPIDFVLDLYKKLEYGAVCISNHDLYTDTTALGDDSLCMVQGVEYSTDEHMLTICAGKSLHGLPHQEAIDEAARRGGFTILCHPNWIRDKYWPLDKISELNGFIGIEVYNGLVTRYKGSGVATDTWDAILKGGRLVYGFGSDDYHMPFDAGRSFTHIYAAEPGEEGIKKAVRAGRFTASTGIGLEEFVFENGALRVKANYLKETYVETFKYRFVTENGIALETEGKSASYKLNGERYVRAEALAENGMLLYTQPLWRA